MPIHPPAEYRPASELVGEYLSWYLDRHPIVAARLGEPGHDTGLGDWSAEGLAATDAARAAWLTRLATADPGPDPDTRIDLDLVLSQLRGAAVLDDPPPWRNHPADYLHGTLYALYLPLLRGLEPEPDVVAGVLAKLDQVPSVLAACRSNTDPELTSPLLAERAAGQAAVGREFLTDVLPRLVGDRRLRARLELAAEPAAEAFDELLPFLQNLTDRARGDWRLGERRYSALLREQELLGYGASELHERGRREWQRTAERIAELTGHPPGTAQDSPPPGRPDLPGHDLPGHDLPRDDPPDGGWRAVLRAQQDDFPRTEDMMLAEYAEQTARARAFLAEHDLVPFADGEDCRVVPAPAFERPVLAVAAYMAPPVLAGGAAGFFYVPYCPPEYTATQREQRLRGNYRASLPTTSVHEAYPGHHWHLSWLAAQPGRVRKVFGTSYFTEGWALYAEGMMHEQGFYTSTAQQLAYLESRLFRAARMVVDTALHCGEMTVEQAEQFMRRNGLLTPEVARGEVKRYCAWPTQAPSYLTGCLEIERIRDDYLTAGRGTLKDFHATIAGSGRLPLGLARRATLG